jgi:hypothetical protein
MTPARRAALRKAQIASAKKRKRRRAVVRTGLGVGVLAGAAVGGDQTRKLVTRRKYQKAYDQYFGNHQKSIRVGRRASRLRPGVMVDRSGNQRGNALSARNTDRWFKAKANKLPYAIKRPRPGYDADRRTEYNAAARRRYYLAHRDEILAKAKRKRENRKRSAARAAKKAAKGK